MVVAESVALLVPSGVVGAALTVMLACTGLLEVGCTFAEGENAQVAPEGSPEQLRLTVPSNEPDALTVKVAALEPFPWPTSMLDAERVPKLKSTTCSVTEVSWVTFEESDPTPWMLNV